MNKNKMRRPKVRGTTVQETRSRPREQNSCHFMHRVQEMSQVANVQTLIKFQGYFSGEPHSLTTVKQSFLTG